MILSPKVNWGTNKSEVKYPSINTCQGSSVRKASEWITIGPRFNPHLRSHLRSIYFAFLYVSLYCQRFTIKIKLDYTNYQYKFVCVTVFSLTAWYNQPTMTSETIEFKLVCVKSFQKSGYYRSIYSYLFGIMSEYDNIQ